MPNSNFSIKVTREESNDIAEALQEKLQKLMQTPIKDMTEQQRHQAGRIETMLRRDF